MSASLAPSARRLVVPAVRYDPREILLTTLPFWLRAPGTPVALSAQALSPPLVSYEGDTFMDDFLATVADPARLPALLAWRDWSEPPSGMLDAKGAPLYPASIVRRAPLKIEPDNGTLDADGVPHGVPAWLRKLYLPLHLRFQFVALDLVCMRNGLPPVDRARIAAAGAVVRRLVRDPAEERWEDWLSADGKTGLWFELKGGLPTDPAAVPAAAYADRLGVSHEVEIARRLGLPAPASGVHLQLGLDNTKLSVLPQTIGAAAKHCSIYGLLPVFSAAQQANDDDPAVPDAGLAAAFHDQALAALADAWADDAGFRARLGPAVGALLDATVLPTQSGIVSTSLNNIRLAAPGANPTDADTLAAVPTIADAAIRRYASASKPSQHDSDPAPNANAFWLSAQINHASEDASIGTLPLAGLNATRFTRAADWNVLVIAHLRDLATSALTTTGTPSGDTGRARALLALALIRLRRLRLALLRVLHQQAFGHDDATGLEVIQPRVIDAVPYNLPAATAGGISGEIEALLQLDAIRAPPEAAPAWPPYILTAPATQLALTAHRAGLALEQMLTPVDEAGAAGGSAYAARIDNRTASAAATLRTRLALAAGGDAVWRLVEAGFDIREQPGRGLLVFPGPAPSAATFSAMAADVANSYAPGVTDTRAEAKAHARVHRLRYDHASLYAVWCWVRVAGRTDCENDQIVWTGRSEPFQVAEPTDVLGAKPVAVQLPDIPKLIRDIPRIARARAKPYAAFNTPPNSGYAVGDDPKDTTRTWGVAWICSFGIPVMTICAFILFSIIFSILIALPGFAWMLLLKFCLPVPVPKKS